MEDNNTDGFSLVEISVVITVIALIIAGVTAGAGLINNSRVNAQVISLQMYKSAFTTFVFQNDAIPGDMNNASSFWPGTNNGDGDGRITPDANLARDYIENRSLFEHLYKAGLIPERYNSTWALGSGFPRLKINSNRGMIAGGFIANGDNGTNYQVSQAEKFEKRVASLYLNFYTLGGGASSYNDNFGVITPAQTYAIDLKIDDGLARKGMFLGYRVWGSQVGDCLTADSSNTYLLTNKRESCNAEFILKK